MTDLTTDSPVSNANSNAQSRILGIFAKAWDPGKVKTRLAKTLGDETAAELYFELLVLHLLRFGNVADARVVAYSPVSDETKDRFLKLTHSLKPRPEWDFVPQVESDLGARMSCFFQQQFDASDQKRRVVLIGSDAPRLSPEIVDEAFEFLTTCDVVFGPSPDGGYYLVGLSSMAESIFQGVDWSTEKVLEQSLAICEAEGLSSALLPELNDIDNEADLKQELELLGEEEDPFVKVFLESAAPLLKGKLS